MRLMLVLVLRHLVAESHRTLDTFFFLKDLFIHPQEFVVGYSKAPEQPQSSATPIYHSHAMTNTGGEPATICIAA